MTDEEFQRLLKRNLTLTADFKNNWGNPYVVIKLTLIPAEDRGEPVTIGTVQIDAGNLERQE